MKNLIKQALCEILAEEHGASDPDIQQQRPTWAEGGIVPGHKIVICQRGFVYAGDVTQRGVYLEINNAVNIRRWGTTRGLGQLASEGNQADTICDACPQVTVHELSVIALMDCEERIHATT